MKLYLFLTLLPLLLFVRNSTSATSGGDYELCNWLGGYYITYDRCVASLQPDPASKTADYPHLAVISLNLTIANTTAVQSKFEAITEIEKNSTTKDLLSNCLNLYTSSVPSLRSAANDAASKNYNGAALAAFNFALMPGKCEDEFRAKTGVQSLLWRENMYLMDLALVAQAINDYLAKY